MRKISGGKGADGTLSTGVLTSNSKYEPLPSHLRGGFRYLRVFLEQGTSVEIQSVTTTIPAAPNMEDPSDYKGHFYSSDDLLNRIWYGCAYTVQLCSIPPAQGRQWPPPPSGWNNSASCGSGDVVLVDGAKRDRMIWPGDMGVSVVTAITTTGDVEASQNALQTLFQYQEPSDGMLPYVGPPIAPERYPNTGNSDTYHLWALIGVRHVHEALPSPDFLKKYYVPYQKAVNCSVGKIGPKGLMVVDRSADWARRGQGGENIAANSLLFQVTKVGDPCHERR